MWLGYHRHRKDIQLRKRAGPQFSNSKTFLYHIHLVLRLVPVHSSSLLSSLPSPRSLSLPLKAHVAILLQKSTNATI